LQVLQAWATCTRPLLFLEHTKYSLATEPFNLPGWTSNNFMVQSLIFSGYCLCVSLSEKSSLLSYVKCAIVWFHFDVCWQLLNLTLSPFPSASHIGKQRAWCSLLWYLWEIQTSCRNHHIGFTINLQKILSQSLSLFSQVNFGPT
jgi:hypothetical protein